MSILFYGMIEGWFTGKKLADYFGGGRYAAVNARRIINGTDKAATIAGYHAVIVDALTAGGYSAIPAAPAPAAATNSPPKVVSSPLKATTTAAAASPAPGFWTRVHAALSRKQKVASHDA